VDLPLCAHLSWWLTAWLRGQAPADALLDRFAVDLDTLAAVRAAAPDGAGLALPVPGDLLGLGGPPSLNAAATEAGEAVVAGSLALVPVGQGFELFPAERRQLPDLGEADRTLRQALLTAADDLARLDVARWHPDLADELLDVRRGTVSAPPGTPPRCVDVAARGARAWGICDLATRDDGGALTALDAERRREALRPLERAARRAIASACSAEVWPPLGSDAP